MDDEFDFDGNGNEEQLQDYNTYEDYLDEKLNQNDLFYLEDQELARQLVEFSYHGKTDVLERDQFHTQQQAIIEKMKNKRE